MKEQILAMLKLQDAMNSKVHPQWVSQNYDWYRAIWIECAELMDHYGWKWWKHQSPDLEQVALELVDIWHFGLSDLLQRGDRPDAIATAIQDASDRVMAQGTVDLKVAVESFTAHTLATKSFESGLFLQMIAAVDMSFDSLYRHYIGKNVLNFFRQDHGYKTGHYHKIWQGREDNEHLVEVVSALDVSSLTFQEDVYQALKARYPDVDTVTA